MTLETIYYVGQTIAVVAILISLAAIWFQMKQTHDLARVDSSRNMWMYVSEVMTSLVEDSDKSAFFHKALYSTGKLTDAEKTRFYLLMSSLLMMFENGHVLHRQGMMEDHFWPRMRQSLRDFIAPPRAQRWWEIARKRSFSESTVFVAEVDAVIAEINAKADVKAEAHAKGDA